MQDGAPPTEMALQIRNEKHLKHVGVAVRRPRARASCIKGQADEDTKQWELLLFSIADSSELADLESLPLVISGAQGPRTIPLGQVAQVSPAIGPARIDHLDRERVITIEANTAGPALSEVVSDIMARINQTVPLPPGYQLTQGG